MTQVLAILGEGELADSLLGPFEEAGLLPAICHDPDRAMGMIASEPPEIILVEAHLRGGAGLRLCQSLKNDSAFGHIPLIAIFPAPAAGDEAGVSWLDPPFDDFLIEPVDVRVLTRRTLLCLCRRRRHLDANPLTHLPGNNAIIQELERRMATGEEFAVCFADLDNFKAFNDKYGFSRGDEAIQLTARLLASTVGQLGPSAGFIGHVGGDDFMFIVPADRAASTAGRIVDHFDQIIASLYDEEDRARGSIVSTNRRGEIEEFPLMSISISVVPNRDGRLKHMGQISALSAELKKQAKQVEGSTVVIDRRGPTGSGID